MTETHDNCKNDFTINCPTFAFIKVYIGNKIKKSIGIFFYPIAIGFKITVVTHDN